MTSARIKPFFYSVWMTPAHYLSGEGCPKCARKKMLKQEFIDKCKEKFKGQNLNFDKCDYVNDSTKVTCICEIHGEFQKYPYQLLRKGEGCPKCSFEKNCLKRRKTQEDFIKDIDRIHGDKYDISNVTYEVGYKMIYPVCHVKYKNGTEHGAFPISANNFLQGCGCPKCSRLHSNVEIEFSDFISSLDNNVVIEDREILEGREIDLFLPDRKIGFEFDGLYWHSEVKKSEFYHFEKTDDCEKNGVKLYHVFEDEWKFKKDIVKSKIKSILGKTENKIYARKCSVREIDSKTLKDFLEHNHLQGNANSKYRYGLYYNEELVSVMSFGHLRKNLGSKKTENTYELLRFCNKLNTTVVGGASKLLKHFIKNINPKCIISYADRRWSDGNLYTKLGFTHIRNSKPNYYYIVGHKRENRFKYRKDVLVKEGFDPDKSEKEIMKERGFLRIYDCGSMVFRLDL